MQEGTPLAELTLGQGFGPAVFAVRSVEDRGENTTKPRLGLRLVDASQPEGRTAKVWRPDGVTYAALLKGNLARVWGRVDDTGAWAGDLTLERAEAVPLPEDLSPYLPALPENHAQTWRTFAELVRSITNPHLKELLHRLFAPTQQKVFADAVAAGAHHHAFRGGLLRHTVEVARLCDATCAVLPFLRRDLLVTAALLHDYGKLTEMEHGLCAGNFTTLGTLVGHLHEGAFQVRLAAAEIPGFPEALRLALEHLVLSHHGKPEQGSPKVPAFPEALVLAECDQISAQATAMHEAIRNASQGQESVRFGDRWLFVGNLGEDTANTEPVVENRFALAKCLLTTGEETER